MSKAEYIGRCKDRYSAAVDLVYRYRGHEYVVTDGHNGYSETLAEQHRREQQRIDKLLEEEQRQLPPEPHSSKVDEAIDMFLRYCEGEDIQWS